MPDILKDEIHLWYTFDSDIRHSPIIKTYASWLCPEEQTRLNNYKIKSRKRQFLVSRALVRSVLSRYDPGIMPGEWRFNSNEYGKPSISNVVCTSLNIGFNVSHAHNLCVIAVSNGNEIGVDCEYLWNKSLNLRSYERFLTIAEFSKISSISKTDQYSSFIEIWTLKEAFLKGLGVGLILPLNEILLQPSTMTYVPDSDLATSYSRNWDLLKFQRIKNYVISVARECTGYKSKSYKIIAKKIIPSVPLLELTHSEEDFKVSDYKIFFTVPHCFRNF